MDSEKMCLCMLIPPSTPSSSPTNESPILRILGMNNRNKIPFKMLRLVDLVAGCRGARSAYSGDGLRASHRSHLGAASHLPYDPPAERHRGTAGACTVCVSKDKTWFPRRSGLMFSIATHGPLMWPGCLKASWRDGPWEMDLQLVCLHLCVRLGFYGGTIIVITLFLSISLASR